jgi:hypothetical protein
VTTREHGDFQFCANAIRTGNETTVRESGRDAEDAAEPAGSSDYIACRRGRDKLADALFRNGCDVTVNARIAVTQTRGGLRHGPE